MAVSRDLDVEIEGEIDWNLYFDGKAFENILQGFFIQEIIDNSPGLMAESEESHDGDDRLVWKWECLRSPDS